MYIHIYHSRTEFKRLIVFPVPIGQHIDYQDPFELDPPTISPAAVGGYNLGIVFVGRAIVRSHI